MAASAPRPRTTRRPESACLGPCWSCVRQAWRKTGSTLEATPVRMGNARQIVKFAHNEFGRAWLPAGRDRATLCKGVLFMKQDMISVGTSDHQIEIPKEALPLWEAIQTLPDMVCVSAKRGKDPVGVSSI